jgi:hypothetical protein
MFHATSPDQVVGSPDLEALFDIIPQAIADLHAVSGSEVVVTAAKDNKQSGILPVLPLRWPGT